MFGLAASRMNIRLAPSPTRIHSTPIRGPSAQSLSGLARRSSASKALPTDDGEVASAPV